METGKGSFATFFLSPLFLPPPSSWLHLFSLFCLSHEPSNWAYSIEFFRKHSIQVNLKSVAITIEKFVRNFVLRQFAVNERRFLPLIANPDLEEQHIMTRKHFFFLSLFIPDVMIPTLFKLSIFLAVLLGLKHMGSGKPISWASLKKTLLSN